ncbi:Outer membrane protein beta-barrel domain-containing protein [Colwellia chukchiensis]|uniref:Outer membrane protein beta-barrel domain-containing protein n=1 Tax=Colwellia chukchiensis TaxID=641665 RepID=A0A1H7TS33_9GAMM|nr:outer membrane beta-barrel protein [Colwellia chukchiensis]SEL87660.1 Outer membrane protein beta-barrel domain-containing protein [Colwellia chukchiensis]
MVFKKSLMALAFLTLPLSASANWSAGGGYANLSEDDIKFGVIYGAVGYEFAETGSEFSFMPELRLGTGIDDDKVPGVGGAITVEVTRFIALSVRGQYNHNSGFYAYVMPSYANLEVKASSFYGSASDDSWELGLGAGLGKKLNANTRVEASYENYDGTDMWTVAFKYAF